jgi:hypothetical protein
MYCLQFTLNDDDFFLQVANLKKSQQYLSTKYYFSYLDYSLYEVIEKNLKK